MGTNFGTKIALCELQRQGDRLWTVVLVVARDRVSDSGKLLYFGRVIFYFLWSPYVIGQTIIFSCCFFFLLLVFFLA